MLVWFDLEEKCLLRRMKMRMRRSLGVPAVFIYFDLGLFLDLLLVVVKLRGKAYAIGATTYDHNKPVRKP
ncbi:uncharacterized protein BDW70DRAFT_128836 [Aspergillus foveolatus]|uniref:uncharacterized protein n=1 Tax=Aspergillus foveolatus TaxID=210207 RepID=UPI003CCDBEC5